ncbi:MAG: tetratricopeptide repeat protein, partial [Planctomycetales bacterium]|nr:tetratricopeptide repeat protein [Planctomycetales bacterium]
MQRYRINYRLLFGVIAGALLLGSLLFFLVHPWQVNRKANLFLERAEQALSSNNLRVAFENQRKYVRLRPEEEEARVKLANLAVDITKLDDATREDHGMAYEVLDVAVRRTGDPGLRRKYADMLMGFGRPQDALVHIQLLQEQNPDDTELQALQVRALFFTKDFRRATDLALGLIGYDKKTKEFDPAKASAGDQPEIYALLGEVLYERSSTRELARQVMDRLVEANPESADAHLKRSIFYYKIRELEEASASLEKAYELAPTDAAVLQRKGLIAMADEDFDAAKEFYSKGLELHPDNLEFYQLLAQTEARRDEIDSALAVLNRGIERAGERNSIGLLMLKIKLLFVKNDLTAVSKEVDALSKIRGINLSTLQPLIDYQRARIKWQEKKWIEASKELNRVRPLLFGFPAEQADAGVLLASAYEQLGKLDLALQAYELVLQSQPQNAPALAGKSRIQARIHPESVADEDFGLNRLIQDMLARPEDQQDWDQVDAALVKNAEENGISEVRLSLHRAQVFLERQMFPEAEKLIQAAANLEPDNVNVRFAAVKLLLRNPGKGPEKGMSLLDRTEQQFGVSIQSRLLRIEALLMQGGDDAAEKIRALAEGVEQWDQNEQMQLYSSLGLAFQRLNQIPESLEYWKKAVELAPSSLPLRMHMFELALQQHDDEAIRDAQKKILDLVGDENDASYVLAEVKRRLVGFNFEKVSREEVLEARGMLEAALKRRPEWSELHVLYGQLLVLLNEDMDLALQHLDDALKYGPANSNAVGLQ